MKCWKCRNKLTRLSESPIYYCSSIECDRFGMLSIDVQQYDYDVLQYDYVKPEDEE